jgi:hypothetical protein
MSVNNRGSVGCKKGTHDKHRSVIMRNFAFLRVSTCVAKLESDNDRSCKVPTGFGNHWYPYLFHLNVSIVATSLHKRP